MKWEEKGIDAYRYGADLPKMAKDELKQNIWAVRFIYWHIFKQGLCMRPPWSMVENIGFGKDGTNTKTSSWYKNPPLKVCPPIPEKWPIPVENIECIILNQRIYGKRSSWYEKLIRSVKNRISSVYLRHFLVIGGVSNLIIMQRYIISVFS
jgi:hypothetical protein